MITDLAEIKIKNTGFDELETKINNLSKEIPFGNSQFQIKNFVLGKLMSPSRKYRAILLNMNSLMQKLKHSYFEFKRQEIDIKELEYKNSLKEINEFDKGRNEITIEEKIDGREHWSKLIKDSIIELECYNETLEKLPEINRDEFENGEYEYYQKELNKQVLGITGAKESLLAMGEELTPAKLNQIKLEILGVKNE